MIFNVLLAFLIYSGITYTWGTKMLHSDQVTSGMTFSKTAQSVGFQDGDVILSIDGNESPNVLDSRFMSSLIEAKEVKVRRGEEVKSIAMPADMMQRLLAAEEGFGSLRLPFVIDSVLPTSTLAGQLLKGDSIIAVDSLPTSDITEVTQALQAKKGQAITLALIRSGQLVEEQVHVDSLGHLGVALRGVEDIYPIEQVNYSILEAIPAGIDRALTTISGYITNLKYIFTKEGAKQMGGLGTMGKLFPTSFDWQSFWSITAFLSVILAVMNILPIPALDGGHILFIIIEMIRRKPLSLKAQMRIQTAGLIFLALLMIYANGNDLFRAIFGK